MPKKRKYNEEYLHYGFTCVVRGDEERPQCVMPGCMKVLGNDSLKPSKLKAHQQNCHCNDVNRDITYFKTLEKSLKKSR